MGILDAPAPRDLLPEAAAANAPRTTAATATDLLNKTTRFTGTVSQPMPSALPGRIFAVGVQTTGLTLIADGTDGFVDDAGNSSATFAPPIVGVRVLHCTTAGQWRTSSGHLSYAALSDPLNGFLSNRGTPVGSPPVIKPAGDGRAGVWEFTHNDSAGYIFHLLAGSGTGAGAWLVGVGIDSGLGNGFIFRNKAQGIGLKIEQTATVSSATGYGLAVEQKNATATAVFMEQKLTTGGAAPVMQLVSYETDTTKNLFTYQGQNGKGGGVRSATGVLEIGADIETNAAAFRARSNNSVAAASRNHAMLHEDTGGALSFYNNTGSAGSWWPFRIRGGGSGLLFETGGSTTAVGTFGTATEVMRLRNGQIGFFGATAVGKRTGWGVATGTAKRTTFDTTTVTLADLAGVVKALIDDLNATTGYGLLAA